MGSTTKGMYRAILAAAGTLLAAAAYAAETDVMDLSLEDLLKADVMTASRKTQRLSDVAGAVFVITREDIERSGVTSIPEALRMVPGVQVARLANNRWAVSVRGFNGRFANKLLVLMDGRSIYSPLFSGVFWEAEDTLLEDIDRIEVIRGPGAALWGANAVNGVINIITRKARDTQGTLVAASAGTDRDGALAARYGGQVGDGHFRVWAKGLRKGESVGLTGAPGNDYWRAMRAGFRGDWNTGSGGRVTVSGGVHDGTTGDRWNLADLTSPAGFVPTPMTQVNRGAHLLGRHEWYSESGDESVLQAYVDRTELVVQNAIRENRTTADLDFQRRMRIGDRNDLVWGLGYRHSRDSVDTQGVFLTLQPTERTYRLMSAFVHDEITLVPESLRLILGERLEHNSFTGLESQPTARLMWTPSPSQAVWGAISRAVRTPSRAEGDALVNLTVTPASPPAIPLPVLLRNLPRPDHSLQSEVVKALEFGYRHQIHGGLSLDATAFRNDYSRLRTATTSTQQLVLVPPFHVVQNIMPGNVLEARTHGFELAADWHALQWWRLQPSYTYLRVRVVGAYADPVTVADAVALKDTAPRHQLSLRSSMTLSGRSQFDLWLRRVGKYGNSGGGEIPGYTTLDLRYAWRPVAGLELSVVGQNLFDRRHPEIVPDLLPSETLQIQRSLYVKAKWQF